MLKRIDERIDRPKVPFDAPHFLFKDFMPESCLEFALAERGRGDAHRFLPAAQENLKSEMSERG